ncbi:FG-GAP-like repeat-containing protein [Nocardioides sediminis]|uniref:FG-GAP-like repeat-containing protein n=1 Tax=Nocardioides sediminis TaxID=433648 RepID=UPI000D30C4B7|nr:FG-GAP-like repeat-containing protein [Nocardioides sediminis]
MRLVQARFITACQQLLALGVVLAFLTPASGVISLDIVGQQPGTGGPATISGALRSATVPTAAVEPVVTEVPLTTPTGSARALAGRTVVGGSVTSSRVTSKPQDVTGYGTVGVTWAHGEELEEDQITLQVRTREGDTWSGWSDLEYHDDHAPDAGSPDAASNRPGTDPLIIGEVDAVQVKASADDALPEDLSVALVEPGRAEATETETPSTGDTSYDEEFEERGDAAGDQGDDGTGEIALQAARKAAQPTIFSRAQWGADESIRNKGSLRYGSISAGFVHHTVNANNYTEAQVPGIIRSIYAYHVKSRGWSDIGYNFLVDRFGRIWEGRYGGIDKPVVGAHTLGYNDYAFAMSAIGNFDTVQPPEVMLQAYGALFAWKLGLHGVNPASMSQQVGKSKFPAINGHRDAGSTACPGRYLYAKLANIRAYAAAGSTAPPPPPPAPTTVEINDPAPQSNLVGAAYPDLVVRRAGDGRGFIVPTGGLTAFAKAATVSAKGWRSKQDVLVTPDVTGDGVVDLVSTSKKGVLKVRPGKGGGKFKATSKVVRSTQGHSLLTAVGDINQDGRNDLVARHKGRLVSLLGAPKGGFKRVVLGKGMGSYSQFVGAGDQNGDGKVDLLARNGKGLTLLKGKGNGRFGARSAVPGAWGVYNRLASGADFNGDGRLDLVARRSKGAVFILHSRGDGSFGTPFGPATNVRSLRSMTGAGNLVGDAAPDLVGVKDNALVVVPHRGTFDLGAPIDTGVSFAGADGLLNVGDWNRDGAGDVVARYPDGTLALHTGNGAGQLSGPTPLGSGFAGVSLTPAGDVTGDGFPDLLGTTSNGTLYVYAGTGSGIAAGQQVAGRKVSRAGLPSDLSRFDWVVAVSDIRAKGKGDYIVRQRGTGDVYLYTGTSGKVAAPRYLGNGMEGFDLIG